MGRRGPRPKSTRLKLLEGNRGKRTLNNLEPAPRVVEFKSAQPPKFLDKVARMEWNRVAPKLIDLRVLTELDLSHLAMYCKSFSLWIVAIAKVDKLGLLVIGAKGGLVRNPAIKISRDALQDATKLGLEFGITPASRSRIKIVEPEPEDTHADEFFNEISVRKYFR